MAPKLETKKKRLIYLITSKYELLYGKKKKKEAKSSNKLGKTFATCTKFYGFFFYLDN